METHGNSRSQWKVTYHQSGDMLLANYIHMQKDSPIYTHARDSKGTYAMLDNDCKGWFDWLWKVYEDHAWHGYTEIKSNYFCLNQIIADVGCIKPIRIQTVVHCNSILFNNVNHKNTLAHKAGACCLF